MRTARKVIGVAALSLVMLATACRPALVAGQGAIVACSDQSSAVYNPPAPTLNEFGTTKFGPPVPSNPILTVEDSDPHRYDLDDPSCGLPQAVKFCENAGRGKVIVRRAAEIIMKSRRGIRDRGGKLGSYRRTRNASSSHQPVVQLILPASLG